MIPRTVAGALAPWQRRLAEAIRSPAELLRTLRIEPTEVGWSAAAARAFPLRVPRGFVARMRPGDADDPLLRQVLPAVEEELPRPGFTADPLLEKQVSPAPGLLHKYDGRALLIVTGACAVHCRYCFRRHFPYGEHAGDWRPALRHLAADTSLREVILSGGDPLSLPDRKLASLATELAAIPHLRRLRVHTRLPVVLPERVDDALVAWLAGGRLRPIVVLHINHAREIGRELRAACDRLRAAGIPLLNQAVLLAGVNDSLAALRQLSEALFDAGVLPYYLNQLDRVDGAAHFEVEGTTARRLHRELAASLPGYLVPRLVRDTPGAPYKLPLID